MIAIMTIEAATDTEIFLAYVEQVLCPVLRSGDVVVMDNLSLHKVRGEQTDRGSRHRGAVPAALLNRSGPHREGLGQAETDLQNRQGKNPRSTRTSTRRSLSAHHPRQCSGLVQAMHNWSTVKREML